MKFLGRRLSVGPGMTEKYVAKVRAPDSERFDIGADRCEFPYFDRGIEDSRSGL